MKKYKKLNEKSSIQTLKGFRQPIIDLFKKGISGEAGHLYEYDLYAAGAVNRAIAIINSFCLLIRKEPLGAMALIRIHLDTLIRFNAANVANDRLDFVKQVMAGARLDKMKLQPAIKAELKLNNNLLSDSNLVKALGSLDKNVESIYQEYCEDIHLSRKTLEMAVQKKSEGIHFSIGTNDFISEEQRTKAIKDMIHISGLFIASLHAYLEHKKTLGSEPEEKVD